MAALLPLHGTFYLKTKTTRNPQPETIKTMAKKRFTSANGITIYVCRKIAKFAFGKENMFAVRCNYDTQEFDIYVKDETEQSRIDYFKEFWGNSFNIIKMPSEDIHKIPTTHGNVAEE